jgi:hypothetical protein
MTSSKSLVPEPSLIIGYTTRRHLLLDLDNTSLGKACGMARHIMHSWPEVGSCLIVLSSSRPVKLELRYSWNNRPWIRVTRDNHHLVFNNYIGYNKIATICETLGVLNVLEGSFIKMRKFRGDLTLRVSPSILSTGVKPAPRPVVGLSNPKSTREDGAIEEYLRILGLCRDLSPLNHGVEVVATEPSYGDDTRQDQLTVDALIHGDEGHEGDGDYGD